MAGHSKWANIRHRKDRQDKKRSKIWSKCSRAIIAAARQGGPDPDTNLSLRYAIDEAKYANMPKDTIQRAVDRGAGASSGENFEEALYEGYGPGGTAILIDTLTDNTTRTVNELRGIFKKHGGSLANSGAVAFMFDLRGQILVDAEGTDEDTVMTAALEGGADDVQPPEPDGDDTGAWNVLTPPTDLHAVKQAIEAAGLTILEASVTRIPQNTVEVRGDDAQKIMTLLEAIEDNEDVQKVSSNVDIPDDELAGMG